MFLEILQILQENTCARASFLIKGWGLIKKETLTQVFTCEFCEISKNTFLTEHLRKTASILIWFQIRLLYVGIQKYEL